MHTIKLNDRSFEWDHPADVAAYYGLWKGSSMPHFWCSVVVNGEETVDHWGARLPAIRAAARWAISFLFDSEEYVDDPAFAFLACKLVWLQYDYEDARPTGFIKVEPRQRAQARRDGKLSRSPPM